MREYTKEQIRKAIADELEKERQNPLTHDKLAEAWANNLAYCKGHNWGPYPLSEGWLPCDGRMELRRKHPELYEAIGDIGGPADGRNFFRVPNLQRTQTIGMIFAIKARPPNAGALGWFRQYGEN